MQTGGTRSILRPGLRLRIAFALALACLLVVGTLGFTLYAASEEMEEGLIDQIIAEVSPEQKQEEIAKLKKAGAKVAMAGDGINDAPALATADGPGGSGFEIGIIGRRRPARLQPEPLFDPQGLRMRA